MVWWRPDVLLRLVVVSEWRVVLVVLVLVHRKVQNSIRTWQHTDLRYTAVRTCFDCFRTTRHPNGSVLIRMLQVRTVFTSEKFTSVRISCDPYGEHPNGVYNDVRKKILTSEGCSHPYAVNFDIRTVVHIRRLLTLTSVWGYIVIRKVNVYVIRTL